MGRYIARRLLQMIPVAVGTTLLIFLMVWAVPGDPFASRCGQRPCSAAFIAAETERLHLDKPVLVQYWYYLWGLLHGDFGLAANGDTVLYQLGRAYPVTAKLTVVAIVIEIVIGIGLGVIVAIRRGGLLDSLSLAISLVLSSLPVFVIGFLAQYILGVKLGIFRVTVQPGAPWKDLIMPGYVLASLSLVFVLRLTRASMLESLNADHVRTAIAKGLPRGMVIRRHVVRNSLIPVITFIGADIGFLLAGAIVTEGIFNIQGVGGLLFHAIRLNETATIVGVCTVLVLVVLLFNLLVDLLYAVLDPRIRYE